jgi:hypothetical protein
MNPTFQIALLHRGWDRPSPPARTYDPELDNVLSILSEACEELASEPSIKFRVVGFGQDPWPVDVLTDLPIVIEQVPKAIGALRAGQPFNLDFVEQGVERWLSGVPTGDRVLLTCRSGTRWEPSPPTIEIGKSELLAMLRELLRSFNTLFAACWPWSASHPWIREWLRPAEVERSIGDRS